MFNWIWNINNPFKGILINIFNKMESQYLIYYKLDLYTEMLTHFQGGRVKLNDWINKFPDNQVYMSTKIAKLYYDVENNDKSPNKLIKELQKEIKRLHKMVNNKWFNFRNGK